MYLRNFLGQSMKSHLKTYPVRLQAEKWSVDKRVLLKFDQKVVLITLSRQDRPKDGLMSEDTGGILLLQNKYSKSLS
jgi:hypothetical protein